MTSILQIKIEINGIMPKIWRRFLVKDNISFQALHDVIQLVMGWENSHLYEFQIGDAAIGCDEEGYNLAEAGFKTLFNSPEVIKMLEKVDLKRGPASLDVDKLNRLLKDAEKNKPKPKFTVATKIGELLRSRGQKFSYLYDFGDSWEHSLKVEKVLEGDAQETPVCLGGERACPPEDCGSIPGYYELQKLQKNKKHPDYEERIVEWLGEDFDFELFDTHPINGVLRKMARSLK